MNLNKKEIIQISATGILVLILLVLVINASRRGKVKKPVSKIASTAPVSYSQDLSKLSGFSKLAEEGKKIEFVRDPFSTKMTEKITSPSRNLSLSGIVWDPQNPTAIINDRIVAVGGDIEGNTVLDIKENRVVLTDGTQNFELKLY